MWCGISVGKSPETITAEVSRDDALPLDEVQRHFEAFADQLLKRKLLILEERRTPAPGGLLVRAIWNLMQYDLRMAILGFRHLHCGFLQSKISTSYSPVDADLVTRIVAAVMTASSLYWHRVQCLQKSAIITRLLRKFGIPAELIIGYRGDPFRSHAWVEVNGRVVNDSQALPHRLAVLDRM